MNLLLVSRLDSNTSMILLERSDRGFANSKKIVGALELLGYGEMDITSSIIDDSDAGSIEALINNRIGETDEQRPQYN